MNLAHGVTTLHPVGQSPDLEAPPFLGRMTADGTTCTLSAFVSAGSGSSLRLLSTEAESLCSWAPLPTDGGCARSRGFTGKERCG